ncbi:unnamed protein product [Schistosoma rodhaini]|nr:unnamed protein product [Schistosoma rodhaini]
MDFTALKDEVTHVKSKIEVEKTSVDTKDLSLSEPKNGNGEPVFKKMKKEACDNVSEEVHSPASMPTEMESNENVTKGELLIDTSTNMFLSHLSFRFQLLDDGPQDNESVKKINEHVNGRNEELAGEYQDESIDIC